MANANKIFLALKGYLEDAHINGLTAETIYDQNSAVQPGKDKMFVSIDLYPVTVAEDRTERLSVLPYEASITVSVPMRLGTSYASSVASRITRRFSEQAPEKCAFIWPGGKFYVTAVQEATGYVENGMYRNTIHVLIDVYELR